MQLALLALDAVLLASCGWLIRLADEYFDLGCGNARGAWPGIVVAGLAFGFLIVSSPEAGAVALAITLGVIFGGKVDKWAWVAGSGIIALFLLIFGLPANFPIYGAFLLGAAGALDEFGHERFKTGKLKPVFQYRLLMEITALPLIFFGVLPLVSFPLLVVFDAGYLLAERCTPKK